MSLESSERQPKARRKTRRRPCTQTLLIFYWRSLAFASVLKTIHPKVEVYVENLGNDKVKRGNLRMQVSFDLTEAYQDQLAVWDNEEVLT